MPVCDPTLEEDFALLQETVRQAGALAMRYYGTDPKSWHKDENQPVTEADIAINDLLQHQLMADRRHYGWLSEETEDNADRLHARKTWIIDPIDGTSAFIKNKPEFAVSAALVENNRPVLGCVFNPASDEFYAARAGFGATKNGKPIRFTGAREIVENMHVCVYPPVIEHQAWKDTWPKVRVGNRNSVAYRLALLAESHFDVLMMLNPKKDWDMAAGDLIVHEAGGFVAGLDGRPFLYNTENVSHRRTLAGSKPMIAELGHRIDAFLRSL